MNYLTRDSGPFVETACDFKFEPANLVREGPDSITGRS